MVVLGDLLGTAERASAALPAELAADIRAAGAEPNVFVRQSVLRFERHASPDEWANLMSRLAATEDPAAACLAFMVR